MRAGVIRHGLYTLLLITGRGFRVRKQGRSGGHIECRIFRDAAPGFDCYLSCTVADRLRLLPAASLQHSYRLVSITLQA